MHPLVSVGLPVYNGADFIAEAIDSILSQTYGNIELIISDNASTDDTVSICREYALKDHRVRLIERSSNFGAINNFVSLIEKANGEYFMWAGSDDYYDKEWIERLLALLSSNHSIAFGAVQYIDQNGCEIRNLANKRNLQFRGGSLFRTLEFIFTPSIYGKMILSWSLFHRESLLDITKSSFVAKYGPSVDLIWTYNAVRRNKVLIDQSVVFYKRVHANAGSARRVQKRIDNKISRFYRLLKAVFIIYHIGTLLSISNWRERLSIMIVSPFMYTYYVSKSAASIFLFWMKKPRSEA